MLEQLIEELLKRGKLELLSKIVQKDFESYVLSDSNRNNIRLTYFGDEVHLRYNACIEDEDVIEEIVEKLQEIGFTLYDAKVSFAAKPSKRERGAICNWITYIFK